MSHPPKTQLDLASFARARSTVGFFRSLARLTLSSLPVTNLVVYSIGHNQQLAQCYLHKSNPLYPTAGPLEWICSLLQTSYNSRTRVVSCFGAHKYLVALPVGTEQEWATPEVERFDFLVTEFQNYLNNFFKSQHITKQKRLIGKLKLELDVISRINNAMGSVFVLDEFLQMVLGRITEIMAADRSSLFLIDHETNECWSKIAQGAVLKEIRFPVGVGIAGAVAATGELINIPDAYRDHRFNPEFDKKTGYHTKSMLTIPMSNRSGQTVGVIQVLNKLSGQAFNKDDQLLGVTLATSIALAIDNVKLYEHYLQSRTREQEMIIASNTQKTLLPLSCPELTHFDLAAFNKPAREMGGDYFDFIPTPDSTTIAIGDITGKGTGAALLMALAHAFIRAHLQDSASIKEAIAKVNVSMCADTSADKFLTLFVGRLDHQRRTLCFTNAGHDAPIWYRRQKNDFSELVTGNIFVGSFPNITYREQEISLESGDLVVFYTDGIVESIGQDLFGEERMRAVILEHKDESAAKILQAIITAVEQHSAGNPQHDDITLIVLRVK